MYTQLGIKAGHVVLRIKQLFNFPSSTATRHGLDGRGMKSRWPARFSAPVQAGRRAPSTTASARSEPGVTRWRTGGEVKGKLANGVGSQYSHATSERGISSITKADTHTSAANSRLNWRPHRFEWTRPFWEKTKSGFCACAIRFRTSYICSSMDSF